MAYPCIFSTVYEVKVKFKMSEVKSVCVYCSMRLGDKKEYVEESEKLGKFFAQENLHLVYGGASKGLMAAIANSVLENGGKVTGIIPHVLKDKEVMHTGLTEIFLVEDMHTRKKMMSEKADAFVIMPGGFGTMDETFEIITWKFLGLHNKPIIIVNIDGYYDLLFKMMDNMIGHDLANKGYRNAFVVVDKVEDVVPAIRKSSQN